MDDLSNTVDGVLGLSNIPIIGGLFRNKQKHQRKLNLMLFIRPTIIRTKSDLVGFTERKYGSMRSRQLEANSRSEYLIRDLSPSVMPPLNEGPVITRLEDMIKPDQKKQENKWWPSSKDTCSDEDFADNPCPDE